MMELSYELLQCPIGQRLEIEYYAVGAYSISYTVEECLEDFCDQVRWELDTYTFTTYNSYVGGMMMIEHNPCLSRYRETLRAVAERLAYGET